MLTLTMPTPMRPLKELRLARTLDKRSVACLRSGYQVYGAYFLYQHRDPVRDQVHRVGV